MTPDNEIRRWLQAIVTRAQHCYWLPEEQLHMKLHLEAWDSGALRTVKAYHEQTAEAERFLLQYFSIFLMHKTKHGSAEMQVLVQCGSVDRDHFNVTVTSDHRDCKKNIALHILFSI